MVLYACHSGSDRDYLNKIARLLRIKVWGFTKVDGGSEEVAHFYELQPDIVGRSLPS
jgi:hypothetical protein